MRAPPQKFPGSFTEPQWQKIALAIKAGLGHDADQIAVFGSPDWFTVASYGPPDGPELNIALKSAANVFPPENMILRTTIEWIVQEVLRRPSSPPWATAEELQQLQRQMDQLRDSFVASTRKGWQEELQQAPETLARISCELQVLMRHMPTKKKLARLSAYYSHRTHLLRQLWILWTDLGGEPTGKAAAGFLKACLEAALGKPESDTGVRHWIERYSHKGIYFHY
jgi:hypothetical protein